MSKLSFSVDISVVQNGRRAPEYKIDTDLNGEITLADLLKFTRLTLISVAESSLKDEQAAGFDKDPVVIVDGKANRTIQQVSPFGKIEFVARQEMKEIILETYTAILGRSPVDTGLYKDSNRVLHNGNQVAHDLVGLQAWLTTNPEFKDTDTIHFINIQPYARKLERFGVTAGRTKTRTSKRKDRRSGQVRERHLQPNGTYFLTAKAIKRKYKRNTSIKFEFIPGSRLGLEAKFAFNPNKTKKPRRTYLYPSITIRVSESGIL